MALERHSLLVVWILILSFLHRNTSFVKHKFVKLNDKWDKNVASKHMTQRLSSYPSSDIPFEPSMLLKIEDNVNNIILIDSLRLQTETLSQSNKLLNDWFSKNFQKLYPSIYSHEINYNEVLRFLQYSPSSYVTATITQKSSIDVSAALNIAVKPYTCILPLLDIKAVLLKDMVDLVYNISRENAKLIECMDELTTNSTSNVFALMSLVSSIQSNSYQNIRLQSTLDTHLTSLSLYAFNDYICKFLVEHCMEHFNSLFPPTTPSELGNNVEEEEDKALLQLFQTWGQSNGFSVYKTTTKAAGGVDESSSVSSSNNKKNKKELSWILSPVILFSTFLQEKGYWNLSKGIAAEIESNSIMLTTLYSYALIMARVTEKLRASLVGMLENHAADVKYYKDIIISLELASATGTSLSFLALSNQTTVYTATTDSLRNDSSSTIESPTMAFIRRVSNSVHYPQLQVTVDNVLLNEDEKEKFLQAHVIKLLNRTNNNCSTWNKDGGDGSDAAGVTAGNPKRLIDGDLSSNNIQKSSSLPFNVNKDSAGETKTSAAGQRKPPSVTTLDPPPNRYPSPRKPRMKDIYVDDSEDPREPTPYDEIQEVESLEEIYAEFGRDCNIRVIGSKVEDDGQRYSMVQCQQRPVGNRRQRVAVNKWIRSERVTSGLNGTTTNSSNKEKKNTDAQSPTKSVVDKSSSVSSITAKKVEKKKSGNEYDEFDDGMLITIPVWPEFSHDYNNPSMQSTSSPPSSSTQQHPESHTQTQSLQSTRVDNDNNDNNNDNDDHSWVCNNPFDTPPPTTTSQK